MSTRPQGTPPPPQQSSALLADLQSEVSSEATPLLESIVRHTGLIVTVLVLLVLAAAGSAVYNWYSGKQAREAQLELSRISRTLQGTERLTALQTLAETAPASLRDAVLLEYANSAFGADDFPRAADAFARLAEADGASALHTVAILGQISSLRRAGKPADALPLLETLENTVPEASRNTVRILLAETALEAGNTTRAHRMFEELAAAAEGPEADYYRYRAQQTGQSAR